MSRLPEISGFKPYGGVSGNNKVFLHLEEYETLRLCDYEMMNHLEASRAMNISRPTLTRIYTSARRKVALAMVEGRQIIIEGGKVYFDSEWYSCSACGCYFNHVPREIQVNHCPLCGSDEIENFDSEANTDFEPGQTPDLCYCLQCGHNQPHQPGQACRTTICTNCGSYMVRRTQRH
jgi:predicted DNA-binding protein (UPF0251 family)